MLFRIAKERGSFPNIKSPFDQCNIIELLLHANAIERAYVIKQYKKRNTVVPRPTLSLCPQKTYYFDGLQPKMSAKMI